MEWPRDDLGLKVLCLDGSCEWQQRPSMSDDNMVVGTLRTFGVGLAEATASGVSWWAGELAPNSTDAPGVLGTTSQVEESEMAVILRDTPSPLDWGWYSNEDPRMHLQTVNKDNRFGNACFKVWLEARGQRTIEWANAPTGHGQQNRIEQAIRDYRERIEDAWISTMIDKRWLIFGLSDLVVTLTAYPRTSGEFQRQISLAQLFPGIRASFTEEDLALDAEHSALVVWAKREPARQQHISLVNRIFLA